ncbi:carboxypeptidase-like regulatory domain-containing protein [Maribacter dokdonensis]|uniref:carboxypeptidase-like regulatory domain-containing protein n=1 Tax=Maribacter dokdonensis TaxID=320912 RepID=UPI001C08B1C3|nr:carboxypeptidase-like regulatory domain-containing protein [Maribacter dokdonensis]MBU2899485.1 carboxypeptidase-like regulatory domain-containing protein [Maribacter dokdonensis]
MKPSFFLFFLLSFIGFSQRTIDAVIVDSADNVPLEFVGVYNSKDHTISNEDGRFQFSSLLDSIIIYRVGYDKLSTTFQKVKDTILLNKSVLELNEVTVTNEKTLWQKVGDSIRSNYPIYPYKEKFLLRGVLRYNGEITRIQDLQGKLERRTLLYTKEIDPDKKDFKVELTNMRKVGLVRDENEVYFIFETFYQLFMNFTPMNATGDAFDLTEATFNNGSKTNLSFKTKPEIENEEVNGHYIINNNDHAIERIYMAINNKDNPYKKDGNIRFRTVSVEKEMSLSKSSITNKYYIATAKYDVKVEVTDDKNSYTSFYDVSFILTTSNHEGDFPVKKNVSTSKDLFKIKYPYDQRYWNAQNQLLLTEEMLDFIDKVQDPNNEFKVRSNIKN